MILEFNTQVEADACLAAINAMAAAWWGAQGYTVLDGSAGKELIGKRNGVDDPTSAKTLTWDTVKTSPDGTYYFESLTGTRPEWVDWKNNLAGMGFTAIGVERDFPSTWDV